MPDGLWTEAKIRAMIEDGVEESLNLDYKGAGSLAKRPEKKAEIVKDATAFANSDGGILIYGVREHTDTSLRHLPSHVDPVLRSEISKEWLEHVLASASPRIVGIIIHPVALESDPNHCIYVVEVPKSDTAHQSTDGRYYRRHNFESAYMQDYEIRDVMNRMKYPVLQVQSFLGVRNVREKSSFLVRVKNSSRVIARRYRVAVKLPIGVNGRLLDVEHAHIEKDEEGHYFDFSMGQGVAATPLFPFDECILEREIRVDADRIVCSRTGIPFIPSSQISLDIFADEMTPYRAIFNPMSCLEKWGDPHLVQNLF